VNETRLTFTLLNVLHSMIPRKNEIIKWGARLPNSAKVAPVSRLLGALHRRCRAETHLLTNLGIPEGPLLELPGDANPVYLFGRSDQYAGERGALELAKILAMRASCFVDVGAHLGYYSFHIAAATRTRSFPVHVIEPNLPLLRSIERNIISSSLPNMLPHSFAIGEADGEAEFSVHLEDPLLSTLERLEGSAVEQVKVAVRSFRSFSEEYDLNNVLVKVDVENSEFRFLQGTRGAEERISDLIIEVLGPAHHGGFIKTASKRMGFEPYYINDYFLQHAPDGKFVYCPPEYNWLLCRRSPVELAKVVAGSRLSVITAGGQVVTP
jgi:FkbM family methyltransferase